LYTIREKKRQVIGKGLLAKNLTGESYCPSLTPFYGRQAITCFPGRKQGDGIIGSRSSVSIADTIFGITSFPF